MTVVQSQSSSFTCCLIGGDTLLTQCGEQLLDKGMNILRVITDANQVSTWANNHNISVVPASSDYATELLNLDYDYLFAITHLALIPEAAVRSPSKGAFNFHDGPLPKYAGLNTPMWALINGETSYGITWHVMAEGIDTGDIAVTESVPIGEEDTAVSLNTKCFTAALDSFPRLVDGLVNNNLDLAPQDLASRQYFGRGDHPLNLSLVDFSKSATDVQRFVRALNTGRYENPLGVPKVLTPSGVYVVSGAQALESVEQKEPGTVLGIGDNSITVACASGALEITQLSTLRGTSIPIAHLQLTVGDNLQFNEDFTEQSAAVGKDEVFWLNRLKNSEAISLPYRSASGHADATSAPMSRQIPLPTALAERGEGYIAGAFVAFLSRVTGEEDICVAFTGGSLAQRASTCPSLLAGFGMQRFTIDAGETLKMQAEGIAKQLEKHTSRAPWLWDLIGRQPALRSNSLFGEDSLLPVMIALDAELGSYPAPQAELALRLGNGDCSLEFQTGVYEAEAIERMVGNFAAWLNAINDSPTAAIAELDILSPAERQHLLLELNSTAVDHDRSLLMHSEFESRAETTPEAIALVAQGKTITYAELNARAEKTAALLQEMGAGADTLIGVYVERSIELMVATLGILKAGAAYVPLDPAFPADRIAFMVEDSAMPIIVSDSSISQSLPANGAQLFLIDQLEAMHSPALATPSVSPDNLCYVIYTSGSTGKPKGVMLEHRNVVNFYIAMDRAIPGVDIPDRAWMAVTSLSFDISVLELFWTLNRGFKVVIYDESSNRKQAESPARELDMGLFMWGNDDGAGSDKYKLLLDGARFFDEHGFAAVWTPERHFHAFGGPYPNPAVTGAAVAAVTEHVKIRAGSCVVPLHHPIRIAEEWSVVDNLSNGRVEIAAASGWNPTDFVLRPENHQDNKQVMYDQLEQVRQLWRGEKLAFDGPRGPVEVQSLPRPVQAELPCWITTAGNPNTWREAGRLGLNVLTHLLGQSVEEVAEKIRVYKEARTEAGFTADGGRVALMLHTFVGDDDLTVKELVREPMKDYLSSSMRLAMDYAWEFPAFKRPGGEDAKPDDVDLKGLSEDEVDTILEFAFERYFETSGLFGTQSRCLNMLARCAEAGVDEIACLLDFGVDTALVLDALPRIKNLRDAMTRSVQPESSEAEPLGFSELIDRHQITHLQCTPSTARMYMTDQDMRKAYTNVPHLLLGGEALPVNLVQEIKSIHAGTLTNMYGPTETTIWSMTFDVEDPEVGISIGKPIANTQIYILDKHKNPVPPGIPGELFIAGEGVARGYLNREALTAERFIADPFSDDNSARMYATGDLAMHLSDGNVDYLGRSDFQVKVRGYRIELGEIEAKTEAIANIDEAAVIVRSADDGDQRLVAYVRSSNPTNVDQSSIRNSLRSSLPEYMVPNEVVIVDEMPRTANGKLDRKALLEIKPVKAREVAEDAKPKSEQEMLIADLWKGVLKLDEIGLNENFFDLGGHSLLVVQLHKQLKETLDQPVSLTDLYQYTTVATFANFLSEGADNSNVEASASRGAQRRALRKRRAS